MRIERYEHGVPSWVDLWASDLPTARAFYGGLFGWDVPEGPPEMGGYTVATLRGEAVAGIGPKMDPAAPAAWMTYVNVDDVDEVTGRASAHGGQVLAQPMDVPEAGRLAILADPIGAVIGLWQPRNHLGAGLVNEPDTYCWSQLFTTDLSRTGEFFESVFGWKASLTEQYGAGHTDFLIGDRPVAGMSLMPEAMPADVPPHWHVNFGVADLEASMDKARESGGAVVFGPAPMGPGQGATIVDPTGAAVSILQFES